MSEPTRFRVGEGEAGRLDRLVARRFPGATRRLLSTWFRTGAVRVDGAVAKKGTFARPGAEVELREPPPRPKDLRPVPEAVEGVRVVFEDARVIAVAKPPGVASHPLRPGETGTVANALARLAPEVAGAGDDVREAGLVHRLDTGTSGVLLAARDRDSWRALRRALSGGRATKQYLAVVAGDLPDRGIADAPLRQSGRRAVVSAAGLPAATAWRVLERWPGPGRALVELTAHTGRMHQVRVHLADRGAPIVGDTDYGGPDATGTGLVGFFLHASRVRLPHPGGGELDVSAPLPPDREAALVRLRGSHPGG